MKTAVVLINLGTPDAPTTGPTRRYLREFLSDPRVIDIPAALRWLLLNLVILPTRPQKSAAAYRTIWTDRGSPLLVHGEDLAHAVQRRIGDTIEVRLAMRYGNPSIQSVLADLDRKGITRIVALPLFPHYAAASGGSAAVKLMEEASRLWNTPDITIMGDFYDAPGFIDAFAEVIQEKTDAFRPDFTLFSYHGLPVRHVQKSEPMRTSCSGKTPCPAIDETNRMCYRAQCYATTNLLVDKLGLDVSKTTTTFQSRLGRTPWIQPYTDEVLKDLYAKGARRLLVTCPSFVADCLETLEEIGIRAAEDWDAVGGEALELVPSLNARPTWADAVTSMVRERLGTSTQSLPTHMAQAS